MHTSSSSSTESRGYKVLREFLPGILFSTLQGTWANICATVPDKEAPMTAPAKDWLTPSFLIELGEQAVAVVAAEIAKETPLVRCQLLASDFFEAWKQQYRASQSDAGRQDLLTAAGVHCCRMRTVAISPAQMLEELQAAVEILRSDAPAVSPPKKSPPVLRVIEGGLSRARVS